MKSSSRAFVVSLGIFFASLIALPAVLAAVTAPEEQKPKSMGKNREEIEAYLKNRLTAIRAGNKTQSDFNAVENKNWQEFWSKLKDERELFETRVAKQRLNVFESLDSLERAEHSTTIADFERMQNNVLRSFETAQRMKTTAFFASQAERLKAFAAKQEKDRAKFAEDAEDAWRQLKAGLAPAPVPRP